MRFAWLALIVFFVGGAESLAQITDLYVSASSEAVKVLRLPPVGWNFELDEMRCGGDYFLSENNLETLPLGAKTGILVETGKLLRGVLFLKTRYQVVFDETESTPTIKYGAFSGAAIVFMPSNKISWLFIGDGATIILRLSKAEFKKASKCLPGPST